MRQHGWIHLILLGTLLILLPVLLGAQEKAYSIIDDLQKYAEEYKYEEFRPINYFGVIDARIRTTGEVEGEKAIDELGLTRTEVIDYARLRFKNNFSRIPFRQLPKDSVLYMLDNRLPSRNEVGVLILDIKIVAHRKIAALNVTLQAGNLKNIDIWQHTEGDYYLRESSDAQSKVKHLIDALMVQLAIDFFKVRLGIH